MDIQNAEGEKPEEDEMFQKRSGTTNEGKDYENSIIAHIVIKLLLDDRLTDFKISSNDSRLGDFDDAVVEKNFQCKPSEKIAFQLKHSTNSKKINSDQLIREKGDYSLIKYCKSYQKLIEAGFNFKLVLMTNNTFKLQNNDVLTLKSNECEINIKVVKVEYEADLIVHKWGQCFKFEVLPNSFSLNITTYRNFFSQFYLLSNQPHYTVVETFTVKLYQNNFSILYENFQNLKNYINEWSKLLKSYFLTKETMQKLIILHVVSPFIKPLSRIHLCSYRDDYKVLEKIFKLFHIVFTTHDTFENILIILNNRWETLKEDQKRVKKMLKKYQLLPKSMQNIDNIDEITKAKIQWLAGFQFLLINWNSTIYQILKLSCFKSVIIFDDNLYPQNDFDVSGLQVFSNLASLNRLDSQLLKEILTFKCLFQGRKINLETLIKICPDSASVITTRDLILMTNKDLVIGKFEELPNVQICRTLSRNCIALNSLQNLQDDNTIIIKYSKNFDMEQFKMFNVFEIKTEKPYVEQISCINLKAANRKTVYMVNQDILFAELEDIVSKMSFCNSSHYFSQISDQKLEWIKSKGSVLALKSAMENTSLLEEKELLHLINNIILITGEPGIGKTVLLKKIKIWYSSKYWTIFFDAKDMLDIIEYGTDYKLLHKYNKLDGSIFDIMYSKIKVVFFWDGLDELFGCNLQRITQIIKSLTIKGFKQFVSCRNSILETLELQFNTFAHRLKPLTENDQKFYIEKRLANLNESKIQKILNYTKVTSYNDILSNPLQISMLVDLITTDECTYGEDLEDFVCITTLYRYSINQKLCLYLTKTRTFYDDYYKAYLLNDLEKASLRCFTQSEIFEIEDDEEINNFLCRLSTEKYINGIIVNTTTSQKPIFLHRSYGEYLTVSYVCKHHKKFPNFRNFIFLDEFRNVRFMFDMLMSGNCRAHLAVLYKNYELLLKYEAQINLRDKGGRSPLHLACSWTESYPRLESNLIDKLYVVNISEDNVIIENDINEKMFSKLIDSCSIEEKDELYGINPMDYAEKAFCLFAVNILAQKHSQIFWPENTFGTILYYSAKCSFNNILKYYDKIPLVKTSTGETLLHVAAKHNNIYLLDKLVLDKTLNINASSGHEDFTPLHLASLNGHEVVVRQLLTYNANVNVSNKQSCTPLHLAVVGNHYVIAELLLKQNADVNATFKNGDTCLIAALLLGLFPLVKLLLEYGADVKLCNKSGCGPIIIPCMLGNYEILKTLLEYDKNIDVNIPYSKNFFPIYIASELGHCKVIKLLLEYGANQYVEVNNKSPIHVACWRGHYTVVQLLINYKVNINITNKFGVTPLHAACVRGFAKVIDLLINHNADINFKTESDDTPIFVASLKGHVEIVEMLLQNKADINIANSTGNYPIHAAVISGKIRIVQSLINCQCNVNVSNKEGITPLHLGGELGHYEIVKLLINSGALLESVDGKGQSALYLASAYNKWHVVKELLENKADPNKLASKGWAPIHVAAYNGNYNVVKILLDNNVCPNFRTADGYPAIYIAVEAGHYEVVQLFISYQVNINATTNKQNATSLHIATLLDHKNILKLLLQNGCFVNAANKNRYTCLYLASQQGNFELVDLLIKFKADVNYATDRGNTPLQAACFRNFVLIAKLLLNSGADINHIDIEGDTALHDACSAGNTETVVLLLKYNADIDIKNSKNKSPLDIVKEKNNCEIMDILKCYIRGFN